LKAAVPSRRQIAAETMPPGSDPVNQTTSGGEFMTDVLNSLGIEYLQEDIAVHMGQGYANASRSLCCFLRASN
jgi:hypothetical protein